MKMKKSVNNSDQDAEQLFPSFYTFKYHVNDERPREQINTTVGWDDGGKIGKIIN